jgi:hypothetical protein
MASLSPMPSTQKKGGDMSTDFTVKILRKYPGTACTSGYLAINDKIICYTLERPWADNMQNISSIPPGTYNAIIRYDHNDHWRIELVGVPGRTHVQIHIGNKIDNDTTRGCILVGMNLGPDLCTLSKSAEAYKALKKSFYGSENPTATPDKSVRVIVE